MSARSLQRAVDRRRRGFQQLGDLGGAELHDVAQDQHRALTRRKLLEGRGDRQPDTVPNAERGLGCQRIGQRLKPVVAAAVWVEVGVRVVRTGTQPRGQHPAGSVFQSAQTSGGGNPVQPGSQRGAFFERRVAAPASQVSLLDEILGIVHRAEHAIAVRNQLATKRRRLFDEILLGRHGRFSYYGWRV
jgi:hypothetical protein